jgi:hypothetical protein
MKSLVIETGRQISSWKIYPNQYKYTRKINLSILVANHPQSILAWSASLKGLDHFNFQSNWFNNTLKRKYLDPLTAGHLHVVGLQHLNTKENIELKFHHKLPLLSH